jgi:hypothetical protein
MMILDDFRILTPSQALKPAVMVEEPVLGTAGFSACEGVSPSHTVVRLQESARYKLVRSDCIDDALFRFEQINEAMDHGCNSLQLFYFILFYFILFYFILFYFILFYFTYSVLANGSMYMQQTRID